MKIRHELNKRLYAQKMEGYERKPYYAKADEFDTITSGDTIKLKSLFASGMMKLSTEKRIQEIRKDTIVSVHIRKCINYIYEDFNADLSIKGVINCKRLLNQNKYKRATA